MPLRMAEQIDSQTHHDEESESLRRTLQHMRKEAEDEVARLNRRLAERDFAPDSSVATATERLAMQQEMMVLQQTLEAKEQALDHITEECRRLEDELEDQNIAFDGLKQEIERKDRSLKEMQAELDRLRRELDDTKQQGAEPRPAAPQRVAKAPAAAPKPLLLFALLGLFLALSLAMVVFLYLYWDRLQVPLPGFRQGSQSPPSEVVSQASVVTTAAAPPTQPLSASRPALSAPPSAPAPRIRNDRLADGSLGPAMVLIDGGVYKMGNNSLSGEDFSPAHAVNVSPFLIGTHEVTFSEYDRFARATGRAPPDDYGWGRGSRPAVGVSWDDAQAYAGWLSKETSRHYRLPSESEWEMAARAGTTGPFWWGFGIEPGRAVCFDCSSRWDNASTAPIGSFPANPFGLFDTAGNAMEWTADCYNPNYQGAPDDGRIWLSGNCANRVARGGSFNKPSASMRVFVRSRFAPETRLNMLGFRIARDV